MKIGTRAFVPIAVSLVVAGSAQNGLRFPRSKLFPEVGRGVYSKVSVMNDAGGGAYRALAGVLVVLGCLCLAAGSAIALYAGWIVLLIITDPMRVALVSYLIELGQTELQAARITIENQAIDIELGEPVYWLLLLLVGVLLIGVISSVAKALVVVGIQILRAGLDESRRVRYPPEIEKKA